MYINCAAFLGCGTCGDIYSVARSAFICAGHGNEFSQPSAMSIFYMSAIGGDVATTFKDVGWGLRLQASLQQVAESFR